MTFFTALGKAMTLWSKYGDKIEATMDIWLADTPAKPPDAAVDALRDAVGSKPMTPGERAAFNREHNIHVRED